MGRVVVAVAILICIIIAASGPALHTEVARATQDGPKAEKPEPLKPADSILDKLKELKKGVTDEAELQRLFGPPDRMECPDRYGSSSVVDWVWERTTAVQVDFKDGKAVRIIGTFSAQVPSPTITPDNFKKAEVGMSVEKLEQLFGKKFSMIEDKDSVTRIWGERVEYKVPVIKTKSGKHDVGKVGSGYGHMATNVITKPIR
jgi:hypothetical protein